MTAAPAPHLERAQLRLLARDGVRRLLSSAVLSREADPFLFAIWTVALAAIPPAGFGLRRMLAYDRLLDRPLADVIPVVLADRTFFVLYAMLAAAVLAALTWEALLPDRDDHEIVGVLPVRARTLAASRLAAAAIVATGLALAVSVPGGLMLALASIPERALGLAPLVLVGHVTGAVLGSLTVFFTLLVVRALLAASAGARLAERLATLLQVLAVAGAIEAFTFLPAMMDGVVRPLLDGTAGLQGPPPTWFVALYSWMAAGTVADAAAGAAAAVTAFVLVAAAAVLAYLGLASRTARRSLERRHAERADRIVPWLGRRAVSALGAAAPVRALLLFTLVSLTRSRRHLLVVATYLGLAAAAGAISLIRAGVRGGLTFETPTSDLLSLGPILLYVLTLALRAAFLIPTDLDANWPLRLHRASVREARAATMLAVHLLVTAPVALLALLVGIASGWPLATAAGIAAMNAMAGLVVVDVALWNWDRIPFAGAYVPTGEGLKRWMLHIPPLLIFVTVTVGFELAAIRAPLGSLYVLAGVALLLGLLRATHRLGRHSPELDFEPRLDQTQALHLSDAIN